MKKFSALSRIFIFALVLCLSVTVFAAVAFDAAEANGNLTITLGENTINKDNTTAAGITYDPATDIITLNGVNGGELQIVCDVSDTFTIKIEGENTLKKITATSNTTTVTFTGTGNLTVTTDSGVNSAIEVKGNITMGMSGTITATANKWTINASGKLEILDGSVIATATAAYSSTDKHAAQAILAKTGITIKNAYVKADAPNGLYGIYSNGGSVLIENSEVHASVGRNYAIWAKGATSSLTIKNSTVEVSAGIDYAIFSDTTISIANSTVKATAGSENAIYATDSVTISDESIVNATAGAQYAIRAFNGDINITDSKIGSESDPVKAVTSNAIYADKGNIDVTSSELYVTAGSSVLYAVAGNITIDNSYASVIGAATGNFGIRAAAGTITIKGQEYDKNTGIGTYVYSKAKANAIFGYAGVSIQGGTVYAEATGADTAIGAQFSSSDGTETAVTITGGNVTAIAVQRPIKGDAVYLKEGRIRITANTDADNKPIFSNGATVTILPSAIVTITANEYADWTAFTLIDDGVSYASGFNPEAIANNTSDVLMTFGSVASKDFTLNYIEWVAAADVYSVDIIWDDQDFEFNYDAGIQGPWDDQKHEYADDIVSPGWTDNEFKITVKNHSSIAVDVTLVIENHVAGLTLQVKENGASNYVLSVPNTEEPTKCEFDLEIVGTPTAASDKVASITLTLKEATVQNG